MFIKHSIHFMENAAFRVRTKAKHIFNVEHVEEILC